MATLNDEKISHASSVEDEAQIKSSDLKLDENGLPLVPQPSDHEDDPLVYHPNNLAASDPTNTLHAELAYMVQILRPIPPLSPSLRRTM
jgi:hypothetical protein